MTDLNPEATKAAHSTEELHKIYDLAYCKQRTFHQKYSPHDRAIEAVAHAVRSEPRDTTVAPDPAGEHVNVRSVDLAQRVRNFSYASDSLRAELKDEIRKRVRALSTAPKGKDIDDMVTSAASAARRDHEAEKLDEALVEKLAEHAVTSRQVVSAILRGAPPITSIEKAIVEAVIAWRRQFPRDKTGNLGIFMEPIAKAADDWLASLRPIPERPAQRECWIVYNKLGSPALSYYWSEESAVDAANNIGGSWRHVPAEPTSKNGEPA